jgi:hypothetical protein
MERRTDLDWLRIIAFGLLILYHIECFYNPYPWQANSIHATPVMYPLMRITTPWRLLLLFVIAGVATRFMLDRMRPEAFIASRAIRLLVPLTFAIVVIVPPQTYVQLLQHTDYSGTFFDFLFQQITGHGRWVVNGQQLPTPQMAHMWFVAYLFVYTLLIVPIGPLLKRLPARFFHPFVRWSAIFTAPYLFLAVAGMFVAPFFLTEWHDFWSDWYAFGVFFAGFVFGYAVAKCEPFFQECERIRWWMLALAIAGYALPELKYALRIEQFVKFEVAFHQMQGWAAVLALFGFARRHLRHDGPVRRYLTDAIFPYYIIHQTVIVLAGFYLTNLHIPVWVEAPALILVTVASCMIGYEIVRRISVLRPLFGLKLTPRRPVETTLAPSSS